MRQPRRVMNCSHTVMQNSITYHVPDCDFLLYTVLRDDRIPEERRDACLQAAIAGAVARKPKAHCFDHPESITEKHLMASIGG